MTKTKSLLWGKVWWPGIDRVTEKLISSCISCLSNSKDNNLEPLHTTVMWNPCKNFHIDLYGPLPTGECILVIIDSSSKWSEIRIIRSTSSTTSTNKLNKTFMTHWFPHVIVTDNAPNLTRAEVNDYCKQYGIKHLKATPYWPKKNAEIERFYRTLGKAIKSINVERRDWRKEIHYFIFQHRTAPHCTTNETTAKLLMGRELKGKIPLFQKNKSKFLHNCKTKRS